MNIGKRKNNRGGVFFWVLFLFIFICIISFVLNMTGLVQKETSEGIKSSIPNVAANNTLQGAGSGFLNEEDFIAERITDQIRLQRKRPPTQMIRQVVITPEKFNSLTPEEKKIISESNTRAGVFLK